MLEVLAYLTPSGSVSLSAAYNCSVSTAQQGILVTVLVCRCVEIRQISDSDTVFARTATVSAYGGAVGSWFNTVLFWLQQCSNTACRHCLNLLSASGYSQLQSLARA